MEIWSGFTLQFAIEFAIKRTRFNCGNVSRFGSVHSHHVKIAEDGRSQLPGTDVLLHLLCALRADRCAGWTWAAKHSNADGSERHLGTSGFPLPVAPHRVGYHRFCCPKSLTFTQLWLSIRDHSDRLVHLHTDIVPSVDYICLFYALIPWPAKDEIILGCHISNSHISLLLTLAICCQSNETRTFLTLTCQGLRYQCKTFFPNQGYKAFSLNAWFILICVL